MVPALKGAKLIFAEATLVLTLRSFCVGLIFSIHTGGKWSCLLLRSNQINNVGFL